MQQMYYCPNCGAPVASGGRFCVTCGISLNWVLQQLPPQPSSLSYNPGRQAGWRQPPVQDQASPDNQALVWENKNQYQKRCMYGNRDAVSPNKNPAVGDAMPSVRSEILKLMDELFDKQIKYN